VFPDNINKIMRKADKVYTTIMNLENDGQYLKNPNEDYFYPGAPSGVKRKLLQHRKQIKIEKYIEKKKEIKEEVEEDSGSDADV
jgi:hypothetical protein